MRAAADPVACPNQTTAAQDGCGETMLATLAASFGGTVQHPDFFTAYATQSGQSYKGRRPPWNVAGVDYAPGVRPRSAPLSDPASLSGQQGCVYSSDGPRLVCQNPAGVTIQGYDFSLHGGVFLQLSSSGGPCVVEDNNFQWSATNAYQPHWWVWFDQCQRYAFSYNTLKGQPWALATTWSGTVLVHGATGDGIVEHNDVEWPNGRFVEFASNGNYTNRYNYYEGLIYNGGNHGEIDFAGGSQHIDYEYNAILIPSTSSSNGVASFAPFYGYYAVPVATVVVSNNVFLINRAGGAGGKIANSVAGFAVEGGGAAHAPVSIGMLTLTGNVYDPSGAYFCNVANNGTTIGTLNESGNVNLLDGSSVTGIVGQGSGEVCRWRHR